MALALKKLDPSKTSEIAYNEWYRVFCGVVVINSVFTQLGGKVGEPYKYFPNDAFAFLEGGQVGWGTIWVRFTGRGEYCRQPDHRPPDCRFG